MELLKYPTLETPRILLKELTLQDTEAVYQHFADIEVTRFMDIPPCQNLKEAEEIIQFHIEDTGCRWGLFSRTENQLMGTCGFHCWNIDEAKAEIGFDLSKAYWGQGLMREALEVILLFGLRR